MMPIRNLAPDEQQRLKDAAGWQLSLVREPSLESSPEYLQWRADPLNAAAHEAVRRAWSSAGALDSTPEALELRQGALARARRASVRRWKTRALGAAAALLVVAAMGSIALYLHFYLPTDYKTDIGERRIVALPDGSRISMDSDTRVRVTYQKAGRSVTLERGRSRFDVAHDPSRPFTVTAGRQTVLAVGTSFDVERLQSTVLITLIQGEVVIRSTDAQAATAALGAPQGSISLKPGEELVVAQNVRPAIVTADLQVARAWEAGRLLFRDEPLGDAVARVNRYIAHPIEIDPSIASIRMSGVFNAGDVGSFISAVTGYFPVEATTSGSNRILLRPRS